MFLFRNPLLAAFAIAIVFFSINGIEEVESVCNSNFDCRGIYLGYNKYCCHGLYSYYSRTCNSDCIGYTCRSSVDCAPGECCDDDDTCRTECYSGLAAGIVAAIVIGVIIVIAVPIGIIVCCCCCGAAAASSSRRPMHGGVIIAQPGMTVVTSQNQAQMQTPGYPPAVGQPQAYVYPPPSKPGQVMPPQYPMQVAPPSYSQ